MKQLDLLHSRFGKLAILRVLIYPITLLLTTPFRWLQSLWNSRVLLKGRWGDYPHFNSHKGLNTLFYWNRAMNLMRFGRRGKSPYLGLGDYNMGRFFHYSKPSMYLYWWAPTILLLAGMFGWLFSHLLWMDHVPETWMILVLGLTFLSSLFYGNTFNTQNYNVLGWLFMPLFLYGLETGNWWLTGISLLLASFGSFTVVFIGGLLLFVFAVWNLDYWPIIAGIPAGLKLLLHFSPLLGDNDGGKVLEGVMKAIGMTRRKTKYKRKKKGRKLSIQDVYHLCLLIQFIAATFLLTDEVPILLIFSLGVFLLNGMVMRFADEQSVHMLIFTTALATMFIVGQEPWLLISFWLLISPLPLLSGYYFDKTVLDILPTASPFNIEPYLSTMDSFLEPVPQEGKVFMAFSDPSGVYENIFDGFRQLVELPAYAASRSKKLFFPEWWGVFELNYEGAPEIWGREPAEVSENMQRWESEHVIVYQKEGGELEPKWSQHGFMLLKEFEGAQFRDDFKDHKNFQAEHLKWFLLKKA